MTESSPLRFGVDYALGDMVTDSVEDLTPELADILASWPDVAATVIATAPGESVLPRRLQEGLTS